MQNEATRITKDCSTAARMMRVLVRKHLLANGGAEIVAVPAARLCASRQNEPRGIAARWTSFLQKNFTNLRGAALADVTCHASALATDTEISPNRQRPKPVFVLFRTMLGQLNKFIVTDGPSRNYLSARLLGSLIGC